MPVAPKKPAVRNQGQSCSLAQLYAPNNMPETLRKAHSQLDKAVDAARVAYLFELYQQQVSI